MTATLDTATAPRGSHAQAKGNVPIIELRNVMLPSVREQAPFSSRTL